MEALAASIIVGAVGIIVALISALLSNRKVNIVADCNKTLLSTDHTGLKEEHKALLAQSTTSHEKLSAQNLAINDNIKNLHHYMELKDAKTSALSSKELDVKNTVEHLNALIALLTEKNNRIIELENELAHLKQQQERPPNNYSQSNNNDDELER